VKAEAAVAPADEMQTSRSPLYVRGLPTSTGEELNQLAEAPGIATVLGDYPGAT
jgi:hypothetical protein